MNRHDTMANPSGRPSEPFEPEAVWIGMRLLRLVGGTWPEGDRFLPRQILLEVADAYQGDNPDKLRALCQGFYLMAHRHYEAALREFEEVLSGSPSARFVRFGELALEAHAFCLQQLDRDDEAVAELLYLMVGKLSRSDERDDVEHAAELTGVVRMLTTA